MPTPRYSQYAGPYGSDRAPARTFRHPHRRALLCASRAQLRRRHHPGEFSEAYDARRPSRLDPARPKESTQPPLGLPSGQEGSRIGPPADSLAGIPLQKLFWLCGYKHFVLRHIGGLGDLRRLRQKGPQGSGTSRTLGAGALPGVLRASARRTIARLASVITRRLVSSQPNTEESSVLHIGIREIRMRARSNDFKVLNELFWRSQHTLRFALQTVI
jgi:hypothetical protein